MRAAAKMRSNTNSRETKKPGPTYLEGIVSGEVRSIVQECYYLLFSFSLFVVFCGNPVTVITTPEILLAFTISGSENS